TEMKMELSDNLEKEFQNKVLPSYLKMKDAFVASDAKQVSVFAGETAKNMNAIDDRNLGEMAESHFSKSLQMLNAIAENTDLKIQRNHFVSLNQNLIPFAINIKNLNPELFIQKCPMANNNKGGFWISATKKIRNPYYGEQMMTCGSIVETTE
ncbi:hypothetical protein LCGC14_1128870, partial [marine sediment metagenome]